MRMARHLSGLLLLVLSLIFSNSSWATDYCADANMVYCYQYTSDWTSGTIPDTSGHSRDLTITGDGKPDFLNSSPVSFGVSGSGGGYADFNGTDAQGYHSDTTEYMAGNNCAIGAWLNPDVTMTTTYKWAYHKADYVLSFATDGSAHISFIRSGGSQTNTETGGSVEDCPDGSWTHLVIVTDFDSSSASDTIFYKNGVSDAGSSGGSFSTSVGVDDRTVVGARASDAYYDGKMDENFFYDGNLTSTQVNEIYDYGLSGTVAAAAAPLLIKNIL